jgi:hypothetical protein
LFLSISSFFHTARGDEKRWLEVHPGAFKKYMDAVESMLELGAIKKGGKELFVRVPDIFLKKFDQSIIN